MTATNADYQIMETELAMNPALKGKIAQAEREGNQKANELELSGGPKRKVVDAYKFAALNRNTNYRVFDMSGGFNSATSSYFHKALGGYHGAKLRSIQNLFDFQLVNSNYKVYDMLNVKYFIQNGTQAQPNPNALGNAWFVKKVSTLATPNDEIRALGSILEVENSFQGTLLVNGSVKQKSEVYASDKVEYVLKQDTLKVPMSAGLMEGMEAMFVMDVNGKTNLVPLQTLQLDTAKSFLKLVKIKNKDEFNPKEEAIMLKSEFSKVGKSSFTGEGSIQMTAYEPNAITYKSESNGEQLAVFSEVYYPEGWTATIDGKPVDIVKTDYLLRGIKVPKGKHTIVFAFDLPMYHKAGTMATVASILILLGLVAAIYTDRKNKKNTAA
jgi:hypothetical protein